MSRSKVLSFCLSLGRRLTGVSVHVKITGMTAGIVLLLGIAVTLQVRARLASDLGRGLEERGIAITRDLAFRSTDLILTGNQFALYELIRDTLESNPDVRYVFVVDAEGQMLVHSFDVGVPPDLLRVNVPAPDVSFQVQILHSDEGFIRDVAVPILNGRAGVARVGLSEHRLQATITRAVRSLLMTTAAALMIGMLAAYGLTRILTRPVLELVRVARAVGKGDLGYRARHYMDDEIGELSDAFNAMTEALARSRDKLVRHNRELAALNAVAAAVSSSRTLKEVLSAALAKTLEIVNAPAGWILLPDNGRSVIAAYQGLSSTFIARETTSTTPPCLCQEVLATGEVMLVPNVRHNCPRLERARLLKGSDLHCHLSIPLQVKDKVLGVMNVASNPLRGEFLAEEISLLRAIGQQVGIAIENAQLWDEVKQKELQRGQLLEKLITAQEDERRRIARELHDEAGSLLTSLMVGLRLLEEVPGTAEQLRPKIAELKGICTRTLEGLHRLSRELRPSALDRLGLVAALEQLVNEFSHHYGVSAHFQALGCESMCIPSQVETSLYRIAQEALTNAARHAEAHTVDVLLERRDDTVVLIVEDDGRGFDAARRLHSDAAPDGHLGLLGMRERATLVGGRFTLESSPGQGTTIFVEIPCGSNADQALS